MSKFYSDEEIVKRIVDKIDKLDSKVDTKLAKIEDRLDSNDKVLMKQ